MSKQSFLSCGSLVRISASFPFAAASSGVTGLGNPGSMLTTFSGWVPLFVIFKVASGVGCNCLGAMAGLVLGAVPGLDSWVSSLSYNVMVVFGGKHLVMRFFDIAKPL